MNKEFDTAPCAEKDTENDTQKIKLRLDSEKMEKTVNSINLPISIVLAAAIVVFVIIMAVIAKGNMNKAEVTATAATAATAEITTIRSA